MEMVSLILVRHAHRDTSDRELDNGLSQKGLKQVRHLEKELIKLCGLKDLKSALFLSSPKRRCVETLFSLSTLSEKGLKVDVRLDEQGSGESSLAFASRINSLLSGLTQFGGTQVWCSHGDWIPAATEELLGVAIPLKKGAALVLKRSRQSDWEVTDEILTKS